MLSTLFVVGMVVAVAACWRANTLNRAIGAETEAPTGVMVVLLIVAVATAGLEAGPLLDGCSLIDPNESWASWLAWIAAGCYWP